MRTAIVGVGVLLYSLTAQAITWDFNEDGNAQGWVAQESPASGGSTFTRLHSEIQDGICRIPIIPFQKGHNPAITLLSPTIGHDSALFDRVSIRFRVVHTQPIRNGFILSWTNALNVTNPGDDPAYLDGGCPPNPNCESRFRRGLSPVVFTNDWQEIVINDLRSGSAVWPGGTEYDILWEGELVDLRMDMTLVDNTDGVRFVEGSDEVPEALEIDWIRLTGVEEQLQGELPPRQPVNQVAVESLFSPPVFYPLGGVKTLSGKDWGDWPGGIGDLDGDGDLDLVTRWSNNDKGGWLLGFNDGKGAFTHTQVEPFSVTGESISHAFVGGADLDGNGLMDLVLDSVIDSIPPQIWLNDLEKGWKVRELSSFFDLRQLIDLDHDGGADLWGYLPGTFSAQFLLNGGKGNFSAPQGPPLPWVKGRYVWKTAFPSSPGTRVPLVWLPPFERNTQGIVASYERGVDEVVQEPLPVTVGLGPERIVQVGDFDQDGYMDLITNDKGSFWFVGFDGRPAWGLNILSNRGDGQVDTVFALKGVQYNIEPQIADVNNDGLMDVVVVHNDIRNPAVVVIVQQKDGRFVREGQYPLPEGRGGPTLSGDLDGDGDLDLVVFDSFVPEGGGVHVLLNQLAEQKNTAVEEAGSAVPTQPRLGTAYPNPFNPGVVIPFMLGPAGNQVSLTIYSILGQEVRKLALGELPAGVHQVAWDGQDGQGKELSSGVYLYRLQAGGWSATGKMVKSQ